MVHDILERKNAFLHNKNNKLKKEEKLGFFQSGQSMGLIENWQFFHISFSAKKAHENVFDDVLEKKKTPFQALKTTCKLSPRIWIFSKGLVHSFSQKMAIFPSFYFLGKIRQANVLYHILERKKPLSRQKVNKAKKLSFFQRGQSKGLVKNWQFFHVFILGITGQKDVFHHNLERKNGFLDFKNNNLIKPLSRQKVNKANKLRFFQRGQSKGLVKNWQFFNLFILDIIGQKGVFYHNLERKSGFLDLKNNNLIQSKNWDLSKGVSPWFWSKIRNYSILLFQPKHYGKMCLTNFYKEKTPSQTIKTTS